jgi:3-hydroxyisobutyrate dehydrogenase-like beta-hydroxyacid dehydrogenase
MALAILTKDTTRVGFIGLGLMGSRLARRLHASGWKIEVWDRTPKRAKAESQNGILMAKSIAPLAAGCDVILSCLANDAAVRSVYLKQGGVLSAVNPGAVIIEMSTISADLAREIHLEAGKKRIRVLDLAISGSTPAVDAGKITLLAGGDRNTFDLCTPIYESIATQWFLIGPAGSGVQMKLVVNLVLGVGMEAIAEAFALGKHLRIDRDMLFGVLSKAAVVPPALLGKFNKIRNTDYSPEFPLRLMHKDLNLILEAASSSGTELPATVAAERVFAAYLEKGGDLDLSAIGSDAARQSASSQTSGGSRLEQAIGVRP